MSLSQMASKAEQADRDAKREIAQNRRRAQAASCEKKIAELVGSLKVPVVALDVVKEITLSVYPSGKRAQWDYVVHRYRVDDVVLRLQGGSRMRSGSGPYAPTVGYVAVERNCETCSRPMGVEIDYYRSMAGKNDDNEQAERFVAQVGGALTKRAQCTFCAADVPSSCPTCGHSNL